MKRFFFSALFSRITPAHFFQSGLAGIYILMAYWLTNALHGELAVASLCASAFIVFRAPHRIISKPRIIIGAYSIGAICGLLGFKIAALTFSFSLLPGYIPGCAIAVALSMLLMLSLKLQHPPAAAFAASITIALHPLALLLAGLSAISLLAALKELLKYCLRDL